MKKNKLLIYAIIGSLGVLFLLYYNFSSKNVEKAYSKSGGFKRIILPVDLYLAQEYTLESSDYQIVGISRNKIILREYSTRELIVFNSDNTKSIIHLPNELNPENISKISVDPFNEEIVEIQCQNDSKVYYYNITDQKIQQIFDFNNYFDKIQKQSQNSFYAFIQGKTSSEMVLSLIQFDKAGKQKMLKESNIKKETMVDDGVLHLENSKLVYINYYNNTIGVIDSTLSREDTFHTIDTITTRPKTVTIRNGTITKFVNAPRPVNQLSQISNGMLYINSYVKSDNDNNNTDETIDVYDTNHNFKYIGSFSFERINNKRMSDFLIKGKKLIVQYPNTTLIYDFSF
ncbi:hypothetical protein ABE426_09940 [Sphingobacterium faecium]|uniref:hypothetical protein n=1 Tax=Sphingobacterium faecium TaxID=34087 RepID=UPI003207DB85